jgi:hypothetical protein
MSGSAGAGMSGEGADREDSRQRATRKNLESHGEPRVSVPLKAVVSILRERQFAYSDFNDIYRKMPDALTILGANDADKNAALAVVSKSRDDMEKEEKLHVRISRSDESGITLDRSEMEAPSKAVADATQQGLRDSLPQDTAEALIASIDWHRYYFNGTKETSFHISRNANGSLSATTTTGTGSFSSGLRSEQYPDNGTPIPADAVFEKRWAPFLQGKMLLPVNR